MKKELKIIKKIIENNRLHVERITACKKAKIKTEKHISSMGPGGIGLVRFFPNLGITRVQIGCNYGGFAPTAILDGNYEQYTNKSFL